MPIFNINNDQNITRVYPKMSEDFSHQNNAKLTNCVDAIEYFDEVNNIEEEIDDTNIPYDHMYASNNENDEVSSNTENCQNTESEVKFLKEWLILHLDLIQQQNDEILDKEKTILILQKENEMLKERINCMEKGTPYQPENHFKSREQREYIVENFTEDMTQDSGPFEEDNKDNIELLDINCDNGRNCGLDLINFDDKLSDTESLSKGNTNIHSNAYNLNNVEPDVKSNEYLVNNFSDSLKLNSEVTECENSMPNFNFSFDFDPMRNLRMSIRRKRVYSNSSAFSNNDSLTDDKHSYRRFKKKRRCFPTHTQVISTPQPYIIQAGETNLGKPTDLDVTSDLTSNLEVPRWRIKHYISCYTMEGTENLDDEVYNKRHSRLENDERRRKRWDVQRIREQRVIEKLKLRQERVGSGSRMEDQNDMFNSMWPHIEDVKFLEVAEELPVCAFGAPIPKINSSAEQRRSWNNLSTPMFNNFQSTNDFCLPWFNNPSLVAKQVNNKRSTVKRKSSKR